MRWLDLFSGIGGFALGLQRAGHETVAFCEIDPFCRKVLAKHWPTVPVYDDVRELTGGRLAADGISVDGICGGFPCQDISSAGKGAGIDGERSGLWREYARLIGEIRPDWVLVENVPALRGRGADRVLGDLEAAGYACRPLVVGAVHAGAPHRRQRVWIVANGAWFQPGRPEQRPQRQRAGAGGQPEPLAHPDAPGRRYAAAQPCGCGEAIRPGQAEPGRCRCDVADADKPGLEIVLDRHAGQQPPAIGAHPWISEPDVGRVAYGVPARVDRLRSLGNAVVPQVVEMIGRAINSANGHVGVPAPAAANDASAEENNHRASDNGDATWRIPVNAVPLVSGEKP